MSSLEVKDSCVDLEGKYIKLKRLDPEEDYLELYRSSHGTPQKKRAGDFILVVDKKSNRKIGQINYLYVVPIYNPAELGRLWCTPEFWGKRAEWKCNADNNPSGKAAVKLGFTEEGVFPSTYDF
ncbi:hypothetical protein BDF21DRAFT_403409 [Thamnidium elegans]|nr:hypothetical protein BDF21DRAFT_403409 [Thamnidium elegans]